MGILVKAAQGLWRIWFYILVAAPILVFAPFLILSTLSQRTYAQFFWLARNLWAAPILYGIGCFPRVHYDARMQKGQSYMLVANHTSILDIMLMLRVSPAPFVFVGKKELVRIPIFGFFYKRVSILVDRSDARSRSAVYRRADSRLKDGLGICIFPEGGVPDESVVLDSFKEGAFRMAINHGIPIVPMVFYDCKRRFPFRFFAGSPGPLRVRVLPFIDTSGYTEKDRLKLRDQVWDLLHDHLSRGPAEAP